MVKKISYTADDLKPIVLELEMELLNVKKKLGNIETSIGLLQTGDKNGPYWNGSNAYHFFKSCSAQIDHDHNLLSHLNDCFDFLVSKCEKK